MYQQRKSSQRIFEILKVVPLVLICYPGITLERCQVDNLSYHYSLYMFSFYFVFCSKALFKKLENLKFVFKFETLSIEV